MRKKFLFAAPLKAICAFTVFCLWCATALGQVDSTPGGQSHFTPGRYFDTVTDIYGKRYSLLSIAVSDTLRARSGSAYSALTTASCGSGYFNLYIESGSGFDTSAAALSVLCKVCRDLSAFINSPLSATGQKVNVWVQNNSTLPYWALGGARSFFILPGVDTGLVYGIADNTVWQTIMTGHDPYLGIAAPLGTSYGSSSGGTFFHAAMVFNFSAVAWNFDYTSPPPAGTYDMYTTILHELTHALGFASEMNSGSGSLLTPPGIYYSRYDRFLYDSAGTPCIQQPPHSCGTMYGYDGYSNYGFSADCAHPYFDSTVCSHAVRYIDGTMSVPVYTPNCFSPGSSLSHFEDECYSGLPAGWPLPPGDSSNNQYFLMGNAGLPGPYSATNPGAMRRYPMWEERQVLCDIGYSANDTFGEAASLNGFHYSGGACPGIQVAGRNDGVDSLGNITIFSPTTGFGAIQINGPGLSAGMAGLLDNDIHADSFECLEVIAGPRGTLSATRGNSSTVVNYTPPAGRQGMVLLRYVPVNSGTGARGNITYVFIDITRDINCSAVTPCDFVINGNFNSGEGSNCGSVSAGLTYPPAQICNWQPFIGGPDLYTHGCTRTVDGAPPTPPGSPFTSDGNSLIIYDPAGDSTSFIGLSGSYSDTSLCGTDTGWVSEGLQTGLAAPLINGQRYVLSFDGLVSNNNYAAHLTWHDTIRVQFFISKMDMSNYIIGGCYGNRLFNYSEIAPLKVLDTTHPTGFGVPYFHARTWQHITDTFTYYGPSALDAAHPQFLQVVNGAYYNYLPAGTVPANFKSYVYLDNISIKAVMSLSASPASVCVGDTLALTAAGGTSPDSFIWYPNTARLYPFDTTTASGGAATSTSRLLPAAGFYHYTAYGTALHCLTPPVTVAVNPLPIPAIYGSTAACIGDTITLTAHDLTASTIIAAGTTFAWHGPSGFYSTSGTITFAPTATGTYTLVATSVYGCIKAAYATVTVSYPLLPHTTTGPSSLCTGSTDTLRNAVTGGTWSSFTPWLATISPAIGAVYGISPGTAFIVYIVSNACGNARDTFYLPVLPAPHAGTLTGADSLCAGAAATLAATASGGTWHSSAPAVATVSPAGVVTAGSVATSTTVVISYIVANSCGADTATHAIRVHPMPAAITGVHTLCGSIFTDTLADAVAGGTWGTGSAIATVSAAGVVTGAAIGASTITYTLAAGGCLATFNVRFDTIPVISAGPDRLNCSGVPMLASIGGATTAVTGYSYAWSPPAGLTATNTYNPVANPSATTSYIVTATRALSGCHASDTVIIMALPSGSTCNPCADFGSTPFAVLGAGGTINANVPAGNYYLPGSASITGNVTITNAVIEIAAGAGISVGTTSQLRIEGSHLYSCSAGMWQGIALAGSGGLIGKVTITGNAAGKSTLIEDAMSAVDVNAASAVMPLTTPGGGYYLQSDNAVFNRNRIGITLGNYTAPFSAITGDTLTYEFQVKNTVFTSRDFSLYKLSGLQYPYNWPGTMGAFGLKTGWNPATLYPAVGPYMAPFNASNPNAGPPSAAYPAGVPYAGRLCHDGLAPFEGISLVGIGGGTAPAYASVAIGAPSTANFATGAPNTELNLFDTLSQGIMGYNTNLVTRNCAFMNMAAVAATSIGLQMACSKGTQYQLVVEPGSHAFGGAFPSTTISPNYFYNCRYGVSALNYYHIRGEGSQMISVPSAFYVGYNLVSRYYDTIKLVGNKITNLETGIAVKLDNGGVPIYGGTAGQITINNNHLQATLPASGTFAGSMHQGIWVENAISYMSYSSGGGSTPPAQVNVDGNYIKGSWNGVYVSGIGTQVATTCRDTIYTQASAPSLGIWHVGCTNNVIQSNTITGNSLTNDSVYGIRSTHCYNNAVSCNYVSNVGRGFQFDNTYNGCKWQGNTMNNCGKGFVLKGASIGTQGSYSFPAMNKWTATGGFGWSTTLGHFQTFTDGSIPTSSPLYVYTGGLYDPVINQNIGGFCARIYGCNTSTGITSGNGNGLAVSPYHIPPDCMPRTNPDQIKMGDVAAGNAGVITYSSQHNWMAQKELWDAMAADDTLGSSSNTLNAFRVMASTSRYAVLSDVEGLLNTGDVIGAQSLLSANLIDDNASTAIDTLSGVAMMDSVNAAIGAIVQNYRNFYTMYIHYQLGTFDFADSAALDTLASACPVTNGAVVYKARALYNTVFNTLRIFDNSCGESPYTSDSGIVDSTVVMDSIDNYDSTENKKHIVNSIKYGYGEQTYELYPNPNNGDFEIRQYAADDGQVLVEVFDAIGKLVYKSNVHFTTTEMPLNIQNTSPGIYLLKLRDSKGRNFIFKFIVQ